MWGNGDRVRFSSFGNSRFIVVPYFFIFVCILPLLFSHILDKLVEIVVLKFCVFVCLLIHFMLLHVSNRLPNFWTYATYSKPCMQTSHVNPAYLSTSYFVFFKIQTTKIVWRTQNCLTLIRSTFKSFKNKVLT